MLFLATTLAFVAAVTAADAPPKITNRDGHIYIQTGGIEQKVTDLLDSKTAQPLFDAQQEKVNEVERRAEKNFADLLEENNAVLTELKVTNKAHVEALNQGFAMVGALLQAQANESVKANAQVQEFQKAQISQSGGGSKTETGGPAFNPMTATVSSLGGDKLRVIFPKAAELVADPKVQVYQCKFTYLKGGKLDASKSKTTEAVSADTERTFSCTVPAWAEPGKMPDEAEFTTNLEVLENGRLMPAPIGGQVINWVPQTPTFKFTAGNDQKLSGGPGKKKAFAIALDLHYDYGEAGLKDVQFTTSIGSSFRSIVTSARVTGSTSERKLEFNVQHPKSAKKEAVYYIDVTVKSNKFKLQSKQRFNIHYKAVSGLAEGAQEGTFTDDAIAQIKAKIGGRDREYTLCYSSKIHGWNPSTFHQRCDGKHDLLQVQKRKNGRVLGGYYGAKKYNLPGSRTSSGYHRGNTKGRAWLFRINPSNSKQAQWLEKAHRSHYIYNNQNYFLTFGGGHDYKCDSGGGCYTNSDYDYDVPGANYRSQTTMTYLAGTYSWNGRNEGDFIEVYKTDE